MPSTVTDTIDRAAVVAFCKQADAQLRPLLRTDASIDDASAREAYGVLESIDWNNGRATVAWTELEYDQLVRWHVTTDAVGDLQIGAGRWLKLGNVTPRTARRRMTLWINGLL
jgi:hypothetical protein